MASQSHSSEHGLCEALTESTSAVAEPESDADSDVDEAVVAVAVAVARQCSQAGLVKHWKYLVHQR